MMPCIKVIGFKGLEKVMVFGAIQMVQNIKVILRMINSTEMANSNMQMEQYILETL